MLPSKLPEDLSMAKVKKIFREPESYNPFDNVPTWVLYTLFALLIGYAVADQLSKTI